MRAATRYSRSRRAAPSAVWQKTQNITVRGPQIYGMMNRPCLAKARRGVGKTAGFGSQGVSTGKGLGILAARRALKRLQGKRIAQRQLLA